MIRVLYTVPIYVIAFNYTWYGKLIRYSVGTNNGDLKWCGKESLHFLAFNAPHVFLEFSKVNLEIVSKQQWYQDQLQKYQKR